MASPAQIAASIANAARSTGPVTASGKDAVSRNALTHGLTSKRLILPGENPADFDALAAAVHHRYNPQSPVERRLVDLIAATEWRLARAWRVHDSLLPAIAEPEKLASDITVAVAGIFSNPQNQRAFSLMLRYLRALERARGDAVKALVATQGQRTRNETDSQRSAATESPAAGRQQGTAPALVPPPGASLTRAERRAIERAQRKAAVRAARGTAGVQNQSALFRTQEAA